MKVPEIRFEGFGGEWEDKELEELLSFKNGINASKEQYGKGLKFINVLDIINNQFITHSNIIGLVDVSDDVFEKNKVEYGDILFQRSSETREEVGQSNVYLDKEKNSTFGGFVIRGKKSGDYNPVFMNFLLKTRNVRKEITTRSGGSTRYNVGQEILKRVPVNIPCDQEQTQIGNTFQKLDSLINQHQQKHDKLSSIKKAMLERMFPKQGETIPEIRFKGFSGEWEEVGLLNSVERIIDFRGRTPRKLGLDWSPSGYRALSALNVKQGYIDFTIDPHFGDQELYERWMSGAELHQEQVLFTTEAPMGNVAQVPNSDKYILSQRTIAFVVKSEVITEDFLAVLLRSPKVFTELSALSSGGTAKGVSQKVLAKLNVVLPEDLNEQIAIGHYFQKLDALINQHQQQITKLNNIKQACLSKMFV